MSDSTLAAVIAGLAVGAALVFLFAFIFNSSSNESNVIIVIIPEGASLADSLHNNFEPETIKVVIDQNNTVRWINQDTVMSSVIADNPNYDSAFYNATNIEDKSDMNASNFLLPNKSFEFTFTKVGEYGYHSVPHPHMRGTVIVVK